MKVALDDDLCSGCGCCTNICPEVFGRSEQGLAVVLENDVPQPGIEPVEVPPEHWQQTFKAALHCPGEIIYITESE